MATETARDTATDEFDTASQKGWEFFTKFLATNVIITIAGLLIIGLLTVWR
jgi:hypothetical protein